MTTAFSIADARIPDDAAFRKACSDYAALLDAMGLVQTEDTGQIDLAAVVKPTAINTVAGYQVWRFNDALQSVAPIYIKVFYGTAHANVLRIQIALGTGSNGAGELAGLVTPAYIAGNSSTSFSLAGAEWHLSGCHTDGFAGVAGPDPAASNNSGGIGSFLICRTCDSNGVATPEGATMIVQDGSATAPPTVVSARFSPTTALVFSGSYALNSFVLNPYNLSATVAGEIPSYLVFHAIPQIIPMHGVCGVLANVMGQRDTFDVAMVGNAPRRYLIPAPNALAYSGHSSGVGFASLAMLWE